MRGSHWGMSPAAGACMNRAHRLSRAASLPGADAAHSYEGNMSSSASLFPSCRLPPISLCKKPFAQTPEHHRLQNSKCSAAPNGVTRLAESLSIMPLAAPLPPFNHSPLCSSVFTTLPSIRETLVFTCTDPTKKNSF